MTRDIRKDLSDYMPRYYAESGIVNGILDAEAVEFEKLQTAVTDVLDQMFIGSATWGLDRWEKLAGISVDPTKGYEQRREVLRSRIRGIGTVRVELIQSLAISYSRGNVEVLEVPSDYVIIITFTGSLGIPDQIDELINEIRKLIPAHLGVEYKFRFFMYNELRESGTYGDLTATGKTYYEILNRGV